MTAPLRRPPRRPSVAVAGPRLAARAAGERRARRRRLVRRGGLVAAVAVPLALLAWLLLASPFLVVGRTTVTGTARLTAEQVRTAAAVPVGTPLARVDVPAVRARVAALAPVAAVQVTRGWPDTLRLRVVERAPVAATALPNGTWELVDGTGRPFAVAPALPAGTARLEVAGTAPPEREASARAALRVLVALPPSLRTQLAAVRAAGPAAVQLALVDGRTVRWGAPGDDAVKAATTEALLRRPGTQLDVSTPGLAVVR